MKEQLLNEVLDLIAHSVESDSEYALTVLLNKLPENDLKEFITAYKIEVFDSLDI